MLDTSTPRGATWGLRLFGWTKIPMIAFLRPRVLAIDADHIEVRIKLGRRSQNHLKSMYFGALAVGADVAAGAVAMFAIEEERRRSGTRVALVFKDVEGSFLRRPDGDVLFVCMVGNEVRGLVAKAVASGEREEMPVPVLVFLEAERRVHGNAAEPVARFNLTLSLKRKN